MKKRLWNLCAIFLGVGLAGLFLPSEAEARCGYYVGYGYRCFGDEGGTGGKVFQEMDTNSKNCGYFDPGCQGTTQSPSPSYETRTYQAPVRDRNYHTPRIGPGYRRPGSN